MHVMGDPKKWATIINSGVTLRAQVPVLIPSPLRSTVGMQGFVPFASYSGQPQGVNTPTTQLATGRRYVGEKMHGRPLCLPEGLSLWLYKAERHV